MVQEDAVYLAKLAEQAERYEGSSTLLALPSCPVLVLTNLPRNGREHEGCRLCQRRAIG